MHYSFTSKHLRDFVYFRLPKQKINVTNAVRRCYTSNSRAYKQPSNGIELLYWHVCIKTVGSIHNKNERFLRLKGGTRP